MKETLKDSLLEIGTEEIPSSYFPPAFSFMKSFSEDFLKSKRLAFQTVQTMGTPRRLSLLITGIASKSEAEIEEISGPSLKAAKDAEGQWTQAAKGFSQSQGVSLDSLEIRTTPKGEYLFAVKKHAGIKAEKILSELYTTLIPSIPFPKKMIWNDSHFKFPRPLRNLVALYGNEVLKIQIAKVKSSNKTFSLSHLSSSKITISSPQNYVTALKNHCILIQPENRKETILNSAEQLARRCNGAIKVDESLLNEVVWLVEHPVAVLGHFDSQFLELPQEVLMTCMKKHQKFFSVLDSKGKLLSCFIGIRNGISENQETVRKGYEKVLLARLDDAQFFFREDTQRSLAFYIDKCSRIIVHEKLGTVTDKIKRTKDIAEYLNQKINDQTLDFPAVERAIQLSKFDLAANMVYEYPELQGIMGEIYAIHYGENSKVAQIIREHYYPITVQGELPTTSESSLAAFADKIESLVGNFLIDRIPSGSSDAYGLRRQSTGLLRILIKNNWNIPLKELVQFSLAQFFFPQEKKDVLQKLILDFFIERFQLLMGDSGYALDEICSVTKNSHSQDCENLHLITMKEKIAALHEIRRHPDFEAVASAYKRSSNILRQARSKQIQFAPNHFNDSLLKEDAEKELYSFISQATEKTRSLIENKKYEETLREWVTLRPALDKFFEKVMVMDPDASLSTNRLSLLAKLDSLFKQIADFSLIQNQANQ